MMTSGLAQPKPSSAPRTPKRNNQRVILHFDYDCFYASVFENENPALKAQPLGVKQKSILATCNYVARARGVKKLMLISDAQKICPDLVLMNGEDLTRFRDVSKRLWLFLRAHSWNHRVERLGLDEVFLDVTDIIDYNEQILNRNALEDSFFQLSNTDPEKGFQFDASTFFGCTYPSKYDAGADPLSNPLYTRLLLASHLAGYLRHKLEELFGYTSTSGISTNKVLAKLAGTQNKPKNQTTLVGLRDEDVQSFLDTHPIRKIPGIGSKISHAIEDHVLSRQTEAVPHSEEHFAKVTVYEARQHDDVSPETLERVLAGPGSERGIGDKIWGLLHGVDDTEVKAASDVPTQISIEDTYMAKPVNSPTELMRELHAISTSLVRRMRVDLVVEDDPDIYASAASVAAAESSLEKRWLAHPRTLRLSTRTRPKPGSGTNGEAAKESFARNSRSQPVPNFVFSLREAAEQVAERLVAEAVLPLFRRLHPERQGWNLALLNVCVANMVVAGSEDGGSGSGGRDISRMFRTQEDKLREFTVYDTSPSLPLPPPLPPAAAGKPEPGEEEEEARVKDAQEEEKEGVLGNVAYEAPRSFHEPSQEPEVSDEDGESLVWASDDGSRICQVCSQAIPPFAWAAHERFHAMGDQ